MYIGLTNPVCLTKHASYAGNVANSTRRTGFQAKQRKCLLFKVWSPHIDGFPEVREVSGSYHFETFVFFTISIFGDFHVFSVLLFKFLFINLSILSLGITHSFHFLLFLIFHFSYVLTCYFSHNIHHRMIYHVLPLNLFHLWSRDFRSFWQNLFTNLFG